MNLDEQISSIRQQITSRMAELRAQRRTIDNELDKLTTLASALPGGVNNGKSDWNAAFDAMRGRTFSAEALANVAGGTRQQASVAIHARFKQGRVRQLEHGVWELVP